MLLCGCSDIVRGVKMLCPAWLLALAVLCAGGSDVRAQCWESAHCRDLSTEESILVSFNIYINFCPQLSFNYQLKPIAQYGTV